jgi:hypothetical protein
VTLLAEIALVAAAAVGVAAILARLPKASSGRRNGATVQPAPRPAQLLAAERLVGTAGAMAIQVHAYVRPVLVEIASRRLAGRGLTLERMPELVGQELLGNQLWEIVRSNRPFPEDRYARGVPLQDLSAMIDVLERL